jgi:rod shape-determining protein MreD
VPESDTSGERKKPALKLLIVSGMCAIILQTALLPHLPFIPDLLLIFCVYLAIHHRSVGGAAGAFCLGYGLDSCSGAPIGTNAFAMSLIFAVIAATARCLWLNNPFSLLFMVLLAVILKTSAFLCLGELGSLAMLLQPMVARYMMWDAILALLLTPVVFTFLYRGQEFGYRT